jgi:hypothetical protein
VCAGARYGAGAGSPQWLHLVGGAVAVLLTVNIVLFGVPRGGGAGSCRGGSSGAPESVHAIQLCGPASAAVAPPPYVVSALDSGGGAPAAAESDAAWGALLRACPAPAAMPSASLGTVEVLLGQHGPYALGEWMEIWGNIAGRLALPRGGGGSVWVSGGGAGGGAAALRRWDPSLRIGVGDASADFAAHAWAVVGRGGAGGGGGGASCHVASRDLGGVPEGMFDGTVLWASVAQATDYMDVFESVRELVRVTKRGGRLLVGGVQPPGSPCSDVPRIFQVPRELFLIIAEALPVRVLKLDTDREVVGSTVWCPDGRYSVLLQKT